MLGEFTNKTRAIDVLEGFLKGISADSEINDYELDALEKWLYNHIDLADIYPFSDLYGIIKKSITERYMEESVRDELIDFCQNFTADLGPVQKLTSEMRKLHGFLHGIISDGVITEDEILALKQWMDVHDGNKNRWPYREIYSLIKKVMEDGKISEDEHDSMMKFFSNFAEVKNISYLKDDTLYINRFMNSQAPVLKTVDDIIDKDRHIYFKNKVFIFTGQMRNGKRKIMEDILKNLGGIPRQIVNKKTDYIVVGSMSNRCWTYSTYGRKIEKAMELNLKGADIKFIDEDFFIKASLGNES